MRDIASGQENARLSSLEVTFAFQPANRRDNGEHSEGTAELGTVPRISRLMALAIRFDGLVQRGEVQDYADLARLGYVTRARITQIMNLRNLAPDIQEALLFLPRTLKGRDPIRERDLRSIARVPHWSRQRAMWAQVVASREE